MEILNIDLCLLDIVTVSESLKSATPVQPSVV